MRTTGVVATIVFFLSATLLCLSIAAPGAAAIGAFRSLPALGLELPAFRDYAAGDRAVMGRVAAGFVLEDLFRFTTWASTVLAVVAGAAWAAVNAARPASAPRWPFRAALVLLIGVIGVAALAQYEESALTQALGEYRDLARLGQRDRAESARAAFDALHRRAELERQLQLAGTLAAIGLAAAALAASSGPGAASARGTAAP